MPKYSPFASGRFRVTSPYGNRPELGDYHSGIDLVDLSDDKIVTAVMGGKVIRSRMADYNPNDRTWEWGNYVAVQQDDATIAYYCHLDSRSVEAGERISAGQKLGVMGNTGKSFGAHLHFEVRDPARAINPADYLGFWNKVGIYSMAKAPKKDYIALVVAKCGLEPQTERYLREYRYAEDLGRKLYQQMV